MTIAELQPLARFPGLLKSWRKRRRLSQLDLSLEAGLSQRHISFLETGRSQPSRFAISQLGEALQMPAAEVDAMLMSAGFAARSPDEKWSDATRSAINISISHILKGHNPFPALAVDRTWTLQNANEAAMRFFSVIGGAGEPNLLRSIFKEGPVRSAIVNWADITKALYRLLELEVARRPNDFEVQNLLDELLSYPGVAESVRQPAHERPAPVLAIHFRMDGADLHLFSLIATVGMSADAAIDDIRVETLLPADEKTRQWFLELES
ncbi:MAG: helix-turn-helix transcriptional regulator [Roseibium sp.]|uniref:helix-turn-helix domain-containing protein n=1 Tax=Roseibium sp. TaxID=1936156 RepID=UPI0026325078|nr:helix-turn-helix transcriptional regulator [Roseibium sp.]MCV0425942.1 helix-turn-helix transcriptional regulator [Roseibium sp.]